MEDITKTLEAIQAAEEGLREVSDGPAWLILGDIAREDALLLARKLSRLASLVQAGANYAFWALDEIDDREKPEGLELQADEGFEERIDEALELYRAGGSRGDFLRELAERGLHEIEAGR